MIYFAQAVSGGPVKIGFSYDVEGRIRELEGHYGRPLALLATLDGDFETEREIHARFDHIRIDRRAGHGPDPEQFQPSADLMEFIGRPILASANPAAVERMDPIRRVVSVRSWPDWKAWVEELAEFDRASSIGELLDRALVAYAREVKFSKPAPKR